MGRVYLRYGTTWYLDYVHPTEGRKRVPTDAKTKGAAKSLLQEIESSFTRVKLGLQAAPTETNTTLWELCSWWLQYKCSEQCHDREKSRFTAHVKEHEIGELPLHKVTAEVLEAHFAKLQKGGFVRPALEAELAKLAGEGKIQRQPGDSIAEPLSAGSVNKLRSQIRAVFSAARKPSAKKWMGANPVADTEPRKVVKKTAPTLFFEEVDPLLSNTPEFWRGFFATGIYLALRKGEICGLLKSSVDLKRHEILVANSYEYETKGNKDNALPIPPALFPYIQAAMTAKNEDGTTSKWLFPGIDGISMRTADSNPEKILRTAMKRAKIIDGYEHSCRRCGHARREKGAPKDAPPVPSPFKPYSETQTDGNLRRCPQCNGKLWAEPIPRGGMWFHCLRHSTATILLRSGVEIHHVQRILRHAKIETTASTYAHLQTADLRGVLNIFAGGKSAAAEGEHTCPTCGGSGKVGTVKALSPNAEKKKGGIR